MTAPMKIIRKSVLKLTQREMAELAGTAQSIVSRWERGELEPDRQQMSAIREAALARGVEWKDEWFFDATSVSAESHGEAASA